MTPQMAGFLLQSNDGNRRLMLRHAENWAKAMESNEWQVGPLVIIDRDGNLIDGQHRLEAVCLCEKPQKFLVLFGVDPNLFEVLDIGVRRTTAQMLQIRGEKDCTTIGAALVLLAKFQLSPTFSGESQKQRVASPTALYLLLLDNPEIRDSVAMVPGGRPLLSRSHIAFTNWLFRRVDKEEADLLTVDFIEGSNLSPGDPVLALRNMIVRYKMEQRRIERKESLAMLVKAWNYRRQNKAITGMKNAHLLSYKDGETFPKIGGFKDRRPYPNR
jgi:hypothetical protein